MGKSFTPASHRPAKRDWYGVNKRHDTAYIGYFVLLETMTLSPSFKPSVISI